MANNNINNNNKKKPAQDVEFTSETSVPANKQQQPSTQTENTNK
jgi:hypothetical protein